MCLSVPQSPGPVKPRRSPCAPDTRSWTHLSRDRHRSQSPAGALDTTAADSTPSTADPLTKTKVQVSVSLVSIGNPTVSPRVGWGRNPPVVDPWLPSPGRPTPTETSCECPFHNQGSLAQTVPSPHSFLHQIQVLPARTLSRGRLFLDVSLGE